MRENVTAFSKDTGG